MNYFKYDLKLFYSCVFWAFCIREWFRTDQHLREEEQWGVR